MLKRTALFDEHRALGGRLIDFGGWELPVQYSGVIDEHLACRNSAGLFDVSHMGEVHVEGTDAEDFLNFLVTNNVAKLSSGQAQYTVMCNQSGGIVDDLVIYRRAHDRFLVVVNASNTEKDFAHMQNVLTQFKGVHEDLRVTNESAHYSQIAIQGRHAEKILQPLTKTPLSSIKTYHFAEGIILNEIPALLARTGYTGEDGFEIYVPWAQGPDVWRNLIKEGHPYGLKPCGLGARDTLRLEMKYPLYGHELTDATHPLEAGLSWVVKLDKGDFLGKSSLIQLKEAGLKRKLVGIRLLDRGIPRQGYEIFSADTQTKIGEITSGTQSPSLKHSIGIGYISTQYAEIGTRISVDIRGTKAAGEVIRTPFYQKPY